MYKNKNLIYSYLLTEDYTEAGKQALLNMFP